MKRAFKIILIVFSCIFLLAVITVSAIFVFCPTPTFSYEKLSGKNAKICFYDRFNKPIADHNLKNCGGSVDLLEINDYTINAFISVEDKRFFSHRGIDLKAIARATVCNLFSRSVKQGGSTISQQLIKNTHLSNEKTLTRKIAEIKLALKLERTYSKQEILQFYLNGIYFGDGCYGLQNAALNYFGKTADNLTVAESAMLAGCVKAPSIYNPLKQASVKRRNLVLKLMYEQGFIRKSEYDNAIAEEVTLKCVSDDNNYFSSALDEAIDKANITPYFSGTLNIYTNFDQSAQDILTKNLQENGVDKKGIVCSKDGKILAAVLPKGDFSRMPASTIKPLLCYAPAIENGKISLATKILDEKCDFNGYSPSNYGNKYNGWIDVLTAIKLSLNVPAVKILQSVGIKQAENYLLKTGININENSLNIALGAYSDGVPLLNLCTAYGVFINGGNYTSGYFVNKVKANGKTFFSHEQNSVKVFREGTCDLINYALKECAKSGTAKALCELPFEICAKTGTNGNANGNIDAYTVCYTTEHIFAFWLGNADNSPMDNSITGGYVTKIANNTVNDFYSQYGYPKNFSLSNDVTDVQLCKFAYEQGRLALKDENAPERYCFNSLFLKGFEPTEYSNEYSNPRLQDCSVDVKDGCVYITVKTSDHVRYMIVREDQYGNQRVFYPKENVFCDENLPDGKYVYTVTAFVNGIDDKKLFGKEKTLPQIKIQNGNWFDKTQWWQE